MKTETALHRLLQATENQQALVLAKDDAKLILDRVNFLESLTAALLRSLKHGNEQINTVIPFRPKP